MMPKRKPGRPHSGRYLAADLPPTFTSAEFARRHGLESNDAGRILYRMKAAGTLYAAARGVYSQRPPLPLTFTAGLFARHFGLSLKQAADTLALEVQSQAVQQRGAQFMVTEAQRGELELRYRGVPQRPALHPRTRQHRDELAGLPWPMTAQEYAAQVGVAGRTADRRIWTLLRRGVLVKVGKRGRAYLYDRAPDPSQAETYGSPPPEKLAFPACSR